MKKVAYDLGQAERVVALMANGVPLQAIAQDPANPNLAALADWRASPDFRKRFARARQLRAEALLDEIAQIAKELGDSEAAGAGDVAMAKLRIETLKWLVERWAPPPEPAQPPVAPASKRRPIIKVITGVPRRVAPPPRDEAQ